MIERLIERLPQWAKPSAEILAGAAKEYGLDRAGRMAAAIAYRTVFALAPMLIIAVSVAGLFLGSSQEAQIELLEGIESIAGPDVAEAMATFLAGAVSSANTAAILGFVLLLWSASSLFIELQHDLNDIFDVPYERISGLIGLVRKRGIGFLWVMSLGVIMIALLVVNAVWGFLDSLLPSEMENLDSVFQVLAPVISFALPDNDHGDGALEGSLGGWPVHGGCLHRGRIRARALVPDRRRNHCSRLRGFLRRHSLPYLHAVFGVPLRSRGDQGLRRSPFHEPHSTCRPHPRGSPGGGGRAFPGTTRSGALRLPQRPVHRLATEPPVIGSL
jgi:hypothetical protein